MPFKVVNDEEQQLLNEQRQAIAEHRNQVVSLMLNVDEAKIAETAKSFDELAHLFKEAEGIDDDIAFARLKVAGAGLHLLQFVIPALQRLGEQCLRTAGASAVRNQCAPRNVNGRSIPSTYKLPEEYATVVSTVVSKVKSALRG
jgi:hypothetical protein